MSAKLPSAQEQALSKKLFKQRYVSDEETLNLLQEEELKHHENHNKMLSTLNITEQSQEDSEDFSPTTRKLLKKVEFSPFDDVKFLATSPDPKEFPSTPEFDASPPSPKSILRSKLNSNTREIKKFAKLLAEDELRIQRLQRGSVLKKWGTGGNFEERFFWVNADASELRWAKPNLKSAHYLEADLAAGNFSTAKITSYKKIELADISFLVFGPRTRRFSGFDWLGSHPENCFSIILPNGDTLDLECSSRNEFMTWYCGIRSLAPLSRKTYNRAQVNWHRALYRTMQFAKLNDLDVMHVWHELVRLSSATKHPEKLRKLSDTQLKIVLHFTGESVVLMERRGSLEKRRKQVSQIRQQRKSSAGKIAIVLESNDSDEQMQAKASPRSPSLSAFTSSDLF